MTHHVCPGYDLHGVEEVQGLYLAEDGAGQQRLRELQSHIWLAWGNARSFDRYAEKKKMINSKILGKTIVGEKICSFKMFELKLFS